MNKFKFRKNIDIGSLMAEEDSKFLEDGFVDLDDIDLLADTDNPKCIILGRTGTGKTAIIKKIEQVEAKICILNPEQLSLKFLSNSNILDYFRKLGVNLDLFYKLLWKHVFIVELLKLHFDKEDIRNQNWIDGLLDKFTKNKKKKRAINYLREWEDSFWEQTEYRIKEIETDLTNRFSESAGISAEIFKTSACYEHLEEQTNEEKKKIEVIHKAEKVINDIQADEIYEILEIMKEDLFSKTKVKHFILIDNLDKDWVDKRIVYDLIKSLIVSLNEINKIPQCKIIITMRENLFQIIEAFGKSRGSQREKFESLNLYLKWNKTELIELINRRFEILMKGIYTNNSPTVDDLFPESKVKSKESGFNYILDRGFYRPRDVISFVNICIQKAEGRVDFPLTIIKEAESVYSKKRLDAIEDEWIENFGDIKPLYKFLRGIKNGFELNDLNQDSMIEFTLSDNENQYSYYTKSIRDKFFMDSDLNSLLSSILIILYRVGIIGIKINHSEKIYYSFDSDRTVTSYDITSETKFYIHKTFHSVLNIK